MKRVLVIGAGPGGEAAAKRAAARGASVTLVERGELGGTCLNRGCIPSKVLLEAGRLLSRVRAFGAWRKDPDASVAWESLQARKNAVVSRFQTSLAQRLAQLKVNVVRGAARFLDDRRVEAAGEGGVRILEFDAAVIATGSRPFFPPPFDGMTDGILDATRALALDHVPKSLVVVGGGAVGLEFACLFQELGSRVVVIEKMAQILPGEDPSVVRVLQQSFEKRGMRILTERTVTEAVFNSSGWRLSLSDGQTVESEQALVCVGRRPAIEGLGLEAAGVALKGGGIAVNEFLQTSRPTLYAVGDVNGLSLLAHAAWAQGDAAVDHLMGVPSAYLHSLVPRCLYTWPEVASVGDGPASAQARGVEAKAQRFFFQGSPKAVADDETEGFLQAVSDKATGRLLGAQIVGPRATELIHIFAVALKGNMTVSDLRSVIFAHPTLSEGIRDALNR